MVFDPNALMATGGELLQNIGIFVAIIVIGLLAGYLFGYLIATLVKRVLRIKEVKEQIAGSEIISLSFWNKLLNGVGIYIKWLFISVGLRIAIDFAIKMEWGNTAMFQEFTGYAQSFEGLMFNIGVFLVFTVAGVVIGAMVYKIVKSALDTVRIEERMAKHGLQDALGGLQLTKVIAAIFMIYVIIVLMATGIDVVAKHSSSSPLLDPSRSNTTLAQGSPTGMALSSARFDEVQLVIMFHSLVELFPEFVLGGLILIAGALIGDFMQDRIVASKASIAGESMGFMVQAMVIFFAIVLALPHFQIKENVDVLTDSFKIIVAGLSIGLAIAMGLGLKDTFSKWGKKVEKKI